MLYQLRSSCAHSGRKQPARRSTSMTQNWGLAWQYVNTLLDWRKNVRRFSCGRPCKNQNDLEGVGTGTTWPPYVQVQWSDWRFNLKQSASRKNRQALHAEFRLYQKEPGPSWIIGPQTPNTLSLVWKFACQSTHNYSCRIGPLWAKALAECDFSMSRMWKMIWS